MTLFLKRSAATSSNSKDVEFVDGAYLFHDEQVSGTLQPSKICDVHFYGMSSPSVGMIDNPGSQHLYWNIQGPLRCSQQFLPGANQSIAITIRSLGRMAPEPECQTQCGDSGCVCVPLSGDLAQMDHILLVSELGHPVTCLCGHFQSKWMPVSVKSWGPLSIVYNVAHYTWNTKGFEYSASYAFNNDAMCGINTITFHSGPCNAWNISVHEYSPNIEDQSHLGELLYSFCPRDKHKLYSLPWKINTVIVRLRVLSRTPPQYKIKWHSQVARANSRLGSPTPVPNTTSRSEKLSFIYGNRVVIALVIAMLLNTLSRH